jgi:geranylgeranyl pyrophosphate synthase
MYSKIAAYFQEDAILKSWPESQELLISIINEKPKHLAVPKVIAGCYTVSEPVLFSATTALSLAYVGIIIMDDVLDGDQRFGTDVAGLANMGAALFSLANLELANISETPTTSLFAQRIVSKMLFDVALGQDLDVRNPDTEEGYWRTAKLKSGAFFKCAFLLGGLAGEAPDADLEILGLLGEEYGLMLQIHDDLKDALAVPANSDWLNGRFTLPILFAHTVDHPWKERFNSIQKEVSDPDLLAEAQGILVRCGALSYGLFQIQEHAQRVEKLLSELNPEDKGEIRKLFDELIVPAEELVNAAAG